MEVKLLSHTDNPKEVIYSAARQCYSKSSAGDIFAGREKFDADKVKKFITFLINQGHMSPLEHVSFTFSLAGISRACTHQLVRHRIASYSQQSQRYVDMENFRFVIPPSVEGDSRAREKYIEIIEYLRKKYAELKSILEENPDLNREEINQDARFILPNAAASKIVVSMNVRELLHFFGERLCLRAQWEIRTLASRMLVLTKEVLPEVFSQAGAKCKIKGSCPEDKQDCLLYPG